MTTSTDDRPTMRGAEYVTMAIAHQRSGLSYATIYGWARRGYIRRVTTRRGGGWRVWYHLGDVLLQAEARFSSKRKDGTIRLD